MSQPDKATGKIFDMLDIELVESRHYPKGSRPRRTFNELDDDALLRWYQMLGAKAPRKLVAELQRRGLVRAR